MSPCRILHAAAARIRCLHDETGASLIAAVGILMAMSAMLAGTLSVSTAAGRHAEYSSSKQGAFALAEAGINNAVSVLNAAYSLGTVAYPGDPNLLPMQTTAAGGGTVTWGGTLQQAAGVGWSWEWRLTATASLPNPTGPSAAPTSATMRAVVPVILPATQAVGSSDVLNWIFALRDADLSNHASVGSPLYAGNNLTLDGQAGVLAAARRLAVGNTVSMKNNHNGVGCITLANDNISCGASYRMPDTYVVGGCAYKGNGNPAPLHTPCLGDGDNVFVAAGHLYSSIPPGLINLPTVTCCAPVAGSIAPASGGPTSSMGFWYLNAAPGPMHGCTTASTVTGTTVAPPVFDTGDATINNSATPSDPINLTPVGKSYTCRVTGSGQTIGELSWNATTKVLTVTGTVFIDGSASAGIGNAVMTYNGIGTIYLSGTFLVKGSIVCAVVASGTCNMSGGAWNPNQRALIVIADGDGVYGGAQSQSNEIAAGDGIEIKSSTFQGALIANKNIVIDTQSYDQGPLVSVYNAVSSSQKNTLSFPTTDFAPSGAGGVTSPPPVGQLLPAISFS